MAAVPPDAGPVLLVMLDRHLGNNVLSLPIAEALGRSFTDGVELLVDERYVALARLVCPSVRVIAAPSRASKWRGPMSGLRWLALFARCALRRYAAVFDFGGSKRQAMLTRLTFSRTRVGLHGRYGWAYTQTVGRDHDEHMYRRVSRLLDPIGADAPAWPTIASPETMRPGVRAQLRGALGDEPARLVVIHPGAGRAYRRWPIERFAQVADSLVRERGMHVAIIASPSERSLAMELCDAMARRERAAVLSLSLTELVALFDLAELMISNESGPTHLASLTALPIVTLFGPTKERWWRPVRQRGLITLRGRACDPRCHGRHCPLDFACLTDTTVSDVLAAANRVAPDRPRDETPAVSRG